MKTRRVKLDFIRTDPRAESYFTLFTDEHELVDKHQSQRCLSFVNVEQLVFLLPREASID